MVRVTVSGLQFYNTYLRRGILDAEDIFAAGLGQHVMKTSAPGAAFYCCNDIIQAGAVQQCPGKKLTWNPLTILQTSDIVDKLNKAG